MFDRFQEDEIVLLQPLYYRPVRKVMYKTKQNYMNTFMFVGRILFCV